MRLTKVSGGTTTSTVPSTSNKVSAVGGTSIVYNSAGAFTSYGSSAYNWNATGQISFISTSGSTVGTYTYNASNQRTKKVAGGNTTHYVYGLGGLLYGEYDGSGNLIREYVYQNGAPLAQIDAGSPEVLTYLHTDHLGTPKYGTNSGGTSVWAANTDPFGVGTPSGSRTVNLRMPGQYYDSESGLFYNWNRYYHPALGRYISSDPIGLAGGPNTFNYASVSPVMFIDPEGLDWVYYEEQGVLSHYSLSFDKPPKYPQSQPGQPQPDYIATGYAGKGEGLNNPAMQHVKNVGPPPVGEYNFGAMYNNKNTGPGTINLYPSEDTEMYGRDLFRLHGDNSDRNFTASNGCIITNRAARNKMDALRKSDGDNKLWTRE